MKLIIPDTHSKEFRALLVSDDCDEQVLALRGYVTPGRMTQVALAAIRRTPELLQCRVESLLTALTLCMEYGLEPDGRHAHLLAQGDAVQVVFDWKGLVALGRRHGIEAIHADVVCANDDFGVGYDGGLKLTHQVDYKKPRGGAYAAYCYYIIEGEPDVLVMTREEIERARAAETQALAGSPSLAKMWEQDWAGMAKRIVVTAASQDWDMVPSALSAPAAGEVHAPPGAEGAPKVPPHNGNGAHNGSTPQSKKAPQVPIDVLRHFMEARNISETSMLDYLKEEGRIADYITRLADVPEPVIEDVVTSWVEMMEEEQGI